MEKMQCHIHGDYVPYGREGGFSHGMECPTCRRIQIIERLQKECGIHRRFMSATFETFKALTTEQKSALEACWTFANEVAEGSDGHLLLLGMPGTGKTHLGCAVGHACIDRLIRVQYLTARDLVREVRSTWGSGASGQKETDVMNRFAQVPLLVFDEVGAQQGTDAELSLMFDLLDKRYADELPTIVISNLGMADLKPFLGDRLIDRLRHNGRVVALTGDSHRKAA